MVGGKRKAATTVTDEEPPFKLRKTKKNTQGSKVSIPSKKGHESNMFQTPQPAISLDQLPLEVLERLVTFLDVVTTISISVPTVPYSKLFVNYLPCNYVTLFVFFTHFLGFPGPSCLHKCLLPAAHRRTLPSQHSLSIWPGRWTNYLSLWGEFISLFSHYYITFHVLGVLGRSKHRDCDREEAIVTDDMHQGKILRPFICQDVIWCWKLKGGLHLSKAKEFPSPTLNSKRSPVSHQKSAGNARLLQVLCFFLLY